MTEVTTEYFSDHLTTYRKRYDCVTAFTMLVENWRKPLDEGKVVGLLSTDMIKAFNRLYHPLLLAKLQVHGFDDASIKLMKSYFTDRFGRV